VTSRSIESATSSRDSSTRSSITGQ
jgi:hypothetical protein